MILEAILALAGTAAIASLVNLFEKRRRTVIPMEVQLPGNLPVISLYNSNEERINFLVDSGSNISHICSEYLNNIDAEVLGTSKEGKVTGLGADNIGITMCKTVLKDKDNNKYDVLLSVSKQLSDVTKTIEESTGVKIHGLLGTYLLKKYKYIIDFNSLKVYYDK